MMALYRGIRLACALGILALADRQAPGATLRVDAKHPTALKSIQKAIDQANNFDTVVVSPGIYYENIDFKAKPITIKSVDPNDPTTVSTTVIDGNGKTVVQFASGETPYSVLRGLSIRNGDAGIFCKNSTCRPQIIQCQIYANSSIGIDKGSATIVRCDIHDNGQNGIVDCGGEIRDCTITKNRVYGIYGLKGALTNSLVAENGTHGVFCYEASSTIAQCVISRNGGRGIYGINPTTTLTVTHSILSGNGDTGLYLSAAFTSVINCTVVGNLINGLFLRDNARLTVANCIIAWNAGSGVNGYLSNSSQVTLRYNNLFSNRFGTSVVDLDYSGGIVPGVGDIQEYPWFAANGYWDEEGWHEGDYHLLSTQGRWDPLTREWVLDPVDSPCIDGGDPNAPFTDEPYPNGGRINLGVYGGTAEASKSKGGGRCTQYPEMDFNRDCKVDQADLDIFMQHWLECNLDDPNLCPPPAQEPAWNPQ
jgi:hypothetical protein